MASVKQPYEEEKEVSFSEIPILTCHRMWKLQTNCDLFLYPGLLRVVRVRFLLSGSRSLKDCSLSQACFEYGQLLFLANKESNYAPPLSLHLKHLLTFTECRMLAHFPSYPQLRGCAGKEANIRHFWRICLQLKYKSSTQVFLSRWES